MGFINNQQCVFRDSLDAVTMAKQGPYIIYGNKYVTNKDIAKLREMRWQDRCFIFLIIDNSFKTTMLKYTKMHENLIEFVLKKIWND